jgi:replicative DNA helicase
MYKIKQTKGDEYIVNESHILSLKLTKMNKKNTYAYINNKKYKKYDIVDISVFRVLVNLSKTTKSRLKGFKVGVENSIGKETPFDPYILGLWLGDWNI